VLEIDEHEKGNLLTIIKKKKSLEKKVVRENSRVAKFQPLVTMILIYVDTTLRRELNISGFYL
jgi:hypothetical protein